MQIQPENLILKLHFSYILTRSVSVRFPRDHAAFSRTFAHRSSRAARSAFAVSVTNITSCSDRQRKENKNHKLYKQLYKCVVRRPSPHLSQTREHNVDSQSPDGSRLQIVLTIGHSQQHSDAHHLGLALKKKAACHRYIFTRPRIT